MTQETRSGGAAAKLAASVLLLAAPAVPLAVALAVWDRLPDPLPRHWNAAGEVDGTSALAPFVAGVLGVIAVLALLGVLVTWLVRDRQVAGFSVAMIGWLVWFLGAVFVGTLLASVDVQEAADVSLQFLDVAVGFVLSLAVAGVLVLLVPVRRSGTDAVGASGEPAMTLAAGEKVVWVGTASSRTFAVVGAVVIVLGAVLAVWQLVPGLGLLVIGLAVSASARLTTRVDENGVHAIWGPFGWPRGRTPLADITGVEAVEARPGEWGGWGYRWSGRGVAHLVRAGDAVVLNRRGRSDLLITVDGAAEARDVVQALIARRAGDAA